MKFSIFSDFHHHPGVFPFGSEKELDIILNRAEKENVDFIIQAGDFCHGNDEHNDFVKKYTEFHIPTYSALGNHDNDKRAFEDSLKLFKMPHNYYYFDCKGYRMIIFDPNYCNVDGEYIHYDMGNYKKMNSARTWIPPEQLEWIRDTIDASPYPCIIIGHASFYREDGVQNSADCLKIFKEANEKRPHSVLMVITGHHHCNTTTFIDNVCHFDINSSSIFWVEKAHDKYPCEMCEEIKLLSNTIAWSNPVHAIITVEGTTVTIEGMDGEYFLGITPQMLGDPSDYEVALRDADCNVLSTKFTIL